MTRVIICVMLLRVMNLIWSCLDTLKVMFTRTRGVNGLNEHLTNVPGQMTAYGRLDRCIILIVGLLRLLKVPVTHMTRVLRGVRVLAIVVVTLELGCVLSSMRAVVFVLLINLMLYLDSDAIRVRANRLPLAAMNRCVTCLWQV